MRRLLLVPLLAVSLGVCASEHVLTVGDTASHTIGLMRAPVYKKPLQNEYGVHLGERRQYKRDNGHLVIIVGGKVASIEERQN